MQKRRICFLQLPWSAEAVYLKISQKGRDQSIDPTHPRDRVENASAPSAGGSPDGNEEGMLGNPNIAMNGEHMTATAETMESPNHRNRQA